MEEPGREMERPAAEPPEAVMEEPGREMERPVAEPQAAERAMAAALRAEVPQQEVREMEERNRRLRVEVPRMEAQETEERSRRLRAEVPRVEAQEMEERSRRLRAEVPRVEARETEERSRRLRAEVPRRKAQEAEEHSSPRCPGVKTVEGRSQEIPLPIMHHQEICLLTIHSLKTDLKLINLRIIRRDNPEIRHRAAKYRGVRQAGIRR